MMKDVITPPHTQHLYPYRWSLEDAVFTKDKGKVFPKSFRPLQC